MPRNHSVIPNPGSGAGIDSARNASLLSVRHSERSEESLLVWSFLLMSFVLVGAFTSAFAQKKTPPAKPIDLNTATAEQLQQLPGIGPVTAKSIVDFRKKSGPFRRTSDLLAVRGISAGRFKQIQSYVVVMPAKPGAAAAKPAAPAKQVAPPKSAAPGR
jgi:competence ComEA-like helix-hairpin-helix protein